LERRSAVTTAIRVLDRRFFIPRERIFDAYLALDEWVDEVEVFWYFDGEHVLLEEMLLLYRGGRGVLHPPTTRSARSTMESRVRTKWPLNMSPTSPAMRG
jgi:hypothetical protein